MPVRRILRWLLATCILLFCSLLIAAWFVAGMLVAPANHDVGTPPNDIQVDSCSIDSESGSRLAGWFFPRQDATATIVLLHPVRADRRAMLGRAKQLHARGYAALLVDLQAHGESPGEAITGGYRERLDVIAAVDFAKSMHPDHRIGIIGWSLGGAATLLASPLEIDALVLESVYPTIEEAVSNRIAMRVGGLSQLLAPALLLQLEPRVGVSPSQLRPIDYVQRVGCPVLVASGDRDCHTTLAETKRLFEAAREPKQILIFSGAIHEDLLAFDPINYERIFDFLEEHLQGKNADSEAEMSDETASRP